MGPNGEDGLFRYKQHYDHLNTALLKNDSDGVINLFHEYLTIFDETLPLYTDKDFLKALCNGETDTSSNSNRNNMLMLIQNLSTDTGSNITFLQKMNNYFQSVAIHTNHVLDTYRPKTVEACQGKSKN